MDIHIVDDDRATRLLYSKIAQKCGFSSASFPNADDYLKAMNRSGYQPPLVILTDVEMPRMNGYQLMCEVRKTYPNQRFIVNSGTPEVESTEDLACLYFTKPVSIKYLQSALLALSSCVESEPHPNCIGNKSCVPDDRTQFNIENWGCPLNAHWGPYNIRKNLKMLCVVA